MEESFSVFIFAVFSVIHVEKSQNFKSIFLLKLWGFYDVYGGFRAKFVKLIFFVHAIVQLNCRMYPSIVFCAMSTSAIYEL